MERQASKKPLLITLGVLVGIIVITVAVTLIMRGRGGARFDGGDVPYPYSWTEKKDGTIALTMETGDVADGAWSVGSTQGDAVEINVGATKGGKTEATLSPVEHGHTTITFSLMSGEERYAELSITVDVGSADGKLAATVSAHRERALQGVVRGGEETGHPFTVRGGDNGLTIFVEDSEGYTDDSAAWESISTDSMVAFVSGIDVSDDGVTVHLETRANGTAEVTVYSVRDNISFVFATEEAEEEDGDSETESEAQA